MGKSLDDIKRDIALLTLDIECLDPDSKHSAIAHLEETIDLLKLGAEHDLASLANQDLSEENQQTKEDDEPSKDENSWMFNDDTFIDDIDYETNNTLEESVPVQENKQPENDSNIDQVEKMEISTQQIPNNEIKQEPVNQEPVVISLNPDNFQGQIDRVNDMFKCEPCDVYLPRSFTLQRHEEDPKHQARVATIPVFQTNEKSVDESPEGDFKSIDKNLQVPNRKILATDYLKENYPGKVLVPVPGDGACLPRAASIPLFKGKNDWIVISKGINKYIRNNWFLIKNFVNFPLQTRVSANDVTFNNEDEYLEFLKTNNAIYIWRDHHDLVSLCEILQVKITVIGVKKGYIAAVHDVLPVSGNMIDENDGRIVLYYDGEHYQAVAPPNVSTDTELLHRITMYINDDNVDKEESHDDNDDVVDKNGTEDKADHDTQIETCPEQFVAILDEFCNIAERNLCRLIKKNPKTNEILTNLKLILDYVKSSNVKLLEDHYSQSSNWVHCTGVFKYLSVEDDRNNLTADVKLVFQKLKQIMEDCFKQDIRTNASECLYCQPAKDNDNLFKIQIKEAAMVQRFNHCNCRPSGYCLLHHGMIILDISKLCPLCKKSPIIQNKFNFKEKYEQDRYDPELRKLKRKRGTRTRGGKNKRMKSNI